MYVYREDAMSNLEFATFYMIISQTGPSTGIYVDLSSEMLNYVFKAPPKFDIATLKNLNASP